MTILWTRASVSSRCCAVTTELPAARRGQRRNPRTLFRPLHGIVLLDKPQGMSSNTALQRVRHLFRAAKAGHTGSLDPLATGLLPLCFGEATKIAGLLLKSRKAYATTAQLGVTTTTDDAEGEVLRERPVPTLDDVSINAALAPLTGAIMQVPPVYSALKRDGVPMYRRARRGEQLDIPARAAQVDEFRLLARSGDTLELHITCASGTYVRSLVRDLGEALGCGAHVTQLRRLWVEPFMDPVMHPLDRLQELADSDVAALDALLLPLEAGLVGYPQVHVDDATARRLAYGQAATVVGDVVGDCVAIDPSGQARALVQRGTSGELRVLRGFNHAGPGDDA